MKNFSLPMTFFLSLTLCLCLNLLLLLSFLVVHYQENFPDILGRVRYLCDINGKRERIKNFPQINFSINHIKQMLFELDRNIRMGKKKNVT